MGKNIKNRDEVSIGRFYISLFANPLEKSLLSIVPLGTKSHKNI